MQSLIAKLFVLHANAISGYNPVFLQMWKVTMLNVVETASAISVM